MNYGYGGKGGKILRDTELTDGCVGDAQAKMYEMTIDGERKFYLENQYKLEM